MMECSYCNNEARHEDLCDDCYRNDMLWDVLRISGGYNSLIDDWFYSVLEAHYLNIDWVDDISKYLLENFNIELNIFHVELINYVLDNGLIDGESLMDYGTSPRGAWLTQEGKKWWKDLKERTRWQAKRK